MKQRSSHPLMGKLALLATMLFASGSYAASYDLPENETGLIEFAPGVISTERFEINTVFNEAGDNVIFARCTDDFSKCVMMESDYVNGQWQAPEVLPFSGEFAEGDPYYSSDYSTLYYISKRPVNKGGAPSEFFNLWYVKRTSDGWEEPVYMQSLSSDKHDLYPSLTDDGRLVFLSFRNQQRQMYQVSLTDNKGTIEALPAHIYGDKGKVGDSMMTRDGKHIIFSISDRDDSLGRGDLYISHLKNGKWTVAQSLGDKVNSPDHEFTPILSPDNKYLFFTRIENGRGNLYQIALSSLGVSL